MTRIYEALEMFDEEQSREDRSLLITEQDTLDLELSPALTETLIGLYRTIFAASPGTGGRIIQFLESSQGTGCSRFIRDFAHVSTNIMRKRVLLLDSDPNLPSNFDFFNQQSRQDWISKLNKERSKSSLKKISSEELLSVNRLSMERGLLPVDTNPDQSEEFMTQLKQNFDLTLVDSWSLVVPPKPRLFSANVDGVILVVEAGKTRWQVVERQKKEIVAQGGKVLGVILNRQTHPIPDKIYKSLFV